MKLSRLAPSSFVFDLRLHTWPNPIKRILLSFMVVLVLVAYMFLAGGIIVFLVMLARWITG
jgi:hypothetical protein